MDVEAKKILAQEDIGHLGEYKVYKALQATGAKFLFNLHVPYGTSESEIDIVMIDISGVYSIECKNYRGIIWGNEDDEYWVYQARKDTYTFYNPIKQNKTHILALSQYIDEPIYNIVVFSNVGKLKVNSKTTVCSARDILSKINIIKKSSQNHIDIDKVYNTLMQFSIE